MNRLWVRVYAAWLLRRGRSLKSARRRRKSRRSAFKVFRWLANNPAPTCPSFFLDCSDYPDDDEHYD